MRILTLGLLMSKEKSKRDRESGSTVRVSDKEIINGGKCDFLWTTILRRWNIH